jgi:hypothetical protein
MSPVARKGINETEKKFAQIMVQTGCGPIVAARQAFNWKCETGSAEAQRAKDLCRSERVSKYMIKLEEKKGKQSAASQAIVETNVINVDQLRKFAVQELKKIRNDDNKPASTRMRAMTALTKLSDPAEDVNLIFKWLDVLWRFSEAHCPCCHKDIPMWKIFNDKLEVWRHDYELPPVETPETALERRLVGLKFGEKRKVPHEGQIPFLEAMERHLVGVGPARSGKSWFMAVLAYLSLMIPGTEQWIIARIYEDARSEQEYIVNFLKTAFHPFFNNLIKLYEDKRSQEIVILTKWGSELRIRSSKSKGSITGRALDNAIIAEPAWVPDDVYEEVRARLSEKLGRILAFGTPKGEGGFLGRMLTMRGRDPKSGKIIKVTADERRLAAGCQWGNSMYMLTLNAKMNPEYVKSEMDAARMELTDEEYASEFLGEARPEHGMKFHRVKDHHLVNIPREAYDDSVFILGLDQGPKNFGGVLCGFDGSRILVGWEFFDNTMNTMKRNLVTLHQQVPKWITSLGGDPQMWQHTITDRAPDITRIVQEMGEEGRIWETDVSITPRNARKWNENWRRETAEWVNNMMDANLILFDRQHCDELFDQVKDCLNLSLDQDKNDPNDSGKGWSVNHPWRQDHVLDAWLFCMHAIMMGRLIKPAYSKKPGNAWEEARAGEEYKRKLEEYREMGMDDKAKSADVFKESFGRPISQLDLFSFPKGHYDNES